MKSYSVNVYRKINEYLIKKPDFVKNQALEIMMKDVLLIIIGIIPFLSEYQML